VDSTARAFSTAAAFTPPAAVQVVTSSHDKTVRLWDLRMGKTLATLTHHKKVRFHCL
jgi:pleiotropic regulator 1